MTLPAKFGYVVGWCQKSLYLLKFFCKGDFEL